MWLPSDRLGHVDAERGRLIRAGQTESGDWDPILEPEASAQGISKYAAKTTDDDLCVSRKRSNAVAQTGWTAAAVDMLPDNSFLAKIYVVVPCVVLAALLVGTAFYSQRHSWTYSTSFYYATQALIGLMYGVPNEVDHLSQGFTLGMYLLGTTLFATAIGTYASLVVHEAIMLVREPPPPADKPEDLDEDGRVGVQDYITWRIGMVFKFIRWEEYKSRYVTLGLTAGWFLFGCLYASVYEGSGLFMAIYFALGAMSCSGSPPPVCIGADATQCSLGTFRAAFYTVYILVGAPLFALAMGQFAGVVVARAEAAAQLQQMSRPIQDREYIYALSLKNLVNKTGSNASDKLRTMYEEYQRHLRRMAPGRASDGLLRMHSKYGSFYSIGNGSIDGGDVSSDGFLDRPNSGKIQNPLAGTSLDFGEFVILELLRLQRVDVSDIERMRTVYSAMDLDASGKLEYSDINKRRFLHEAHFDP